MSLWLREIYSWWHESAHTCHRGTLTLLLHTSISKARLSWVAGKVLINSFPHFYFHYINHHRARQGTTPLQEESIRLNVKNYSRSVSRSSSRECGCFMWKISHQGIIFSIPHYHHGGERLRAKQFFLYYFYLSAGCFFNHQQIPIYYTSYFSATPSWRWRCCWCWYLEAR